MTGPLGFLDKYIPKQQAPQKQAPDPLAFLNQYIPQQSVVEKSASSEQGFLNYTKNLLVHGYKLYDFMTGNIDPNDPDNVAIMQALSDPIQKEKMKDFGSLFTFLTKGVPNQVKESASQFIKQGFSIDAIPGFLKGLE